MGKRDYLKLGDNNVICDRCGAKYKSSQCRFDGGNSIRGSKLFVCKQCWDPINPQLFVRGRIDDQTVAVSRPDVAPRFITTPVTPEDL